MGQGDHAEGEGDGAEDLGTPAPVGSPPKPQPDNFRRAPADVEYDRVRDAGMEQRSAAGDHESRLLGGRDDLDIEPDLLLHSGQEVLAVGCSAARLGGDIARAGDAARLNFRGADPQRVEGTLHRLLGQGAGCGKPFAQSDDAGKGVDNAKAYAGRPRDEQSAIVRAEIECRELRSKAACDRRRVRDRKIPGSGRLELHRCARQLAARLRKSVRTRQRGGTSDPFPVAERLLHCRRTIQLHWTAMLAQPGAKSKPCNRDATIMGEPLPNAGSMCYRGRFARASLDTRPGATDPRMGDRLTVGQRTLTPPV